MYRILLLNREFTCLTDHRSISWFTSICPKSPKLLRCALTFQEFKMKIVYRKGASNKPADCLSRAFPEVPECEYQDVCIACGKPRNDSSPNPIQSNKQEKSQGNEQGKNKIFYVGQRVFEEFTPRSESPSNPNEQLTAMTLHSAIPQNIHERLSDVPLCESSDSPPPQLWTPSSAN